MQAKPGGSSSRNQRNPPAAEPPAAEPPAGDTQAGETRAYAKLLEQVNAGLRAFIAEMTTVFRFIETVSRLQSLERIVELLMDVLKDLCGYHAAALYLASDPGGFQKLKRAVDLPQIERCRDRLEIDQGIYDWIFQQHHAVLVPKRFSVEIQPENEWSFMVVPLAADTGRLGRIEMVFHRAQGTFTQQTFDILNVLISHALMIIMKERLHEKEREAVRKYRELDLLKQDVIYTTSHEIRTPLTVIQAASILLEKESSMPEAERLHLYRRITGQCGRINRIVGEMLETSRLEEGELQMTPEPVMLPAMTEEIIRDLDFNPEIIAIRTEYQEGLSPVRADRASLQKILLNLIENAIKYSPQGGQIEISACNLDHQVRWQIKDPGMGIPEPDQKHVFDKFYRGGTSTTRGTRGLGLGLYIVKKNVELNGGSITFTSQPGHGSCFTIELPKGKLPG